MRRRPSMTRAALALAAFAAATSAAVAADAPAAAPAAPPASATYDPALARQTGADEHGMRKYVFVLLKTGPQRMPDGPARDAMFAGHFANIKRLAAVGKLVMAGPYDGVDGWRGMFVFAVDDIDEARALVATDPVVINGEMVPEFHKLYGSAAFMLVNGLHAQVSLKPF